MASNVEVFTERLERQTKEREAFLESISIKNYKANLVTCPGCGSKIAKRFFETTDCPLCGESMLSQTNKDRLKSFDDRIATTASNLKKAQESAARRAGIPIESDESAEDTSDTVSTTDEGSEVSADDEGDNE